MPHQDFDPKIDALAEAFGRAAALMLETVLAFVRGQLTARDASRMVGDVLASLAGFVGAWTRDVLPGIYRDGVEEAHKALEAGEDAPRRAEGTMASPEHRAMLELAQRGLERDLAATGEQMRRDAESALEEVTRRNLESLMAEGRNAVPQAADMAREMEERGIAFTDRSGRRWKPRDYARMVLRTQSVEASNSANLTTAGQLGSPGVRVSDGGPGDTDEPCQQANGQKWGTAYALANKLEHPNCRRAFAPLPSTWTGELDRE